MNQVMMSFNPTILLIVFIVINVVAKEMFYKRFEKNPTNMTLVLMLSIFSIVVYPVFVLPAYIIAYRKFMKKVRNEFMPVWENIKISPSEELADQLMDVINKYGINNQPKIWNELRGIWFVVNECPEISTAKKSELRNFLMTKGLRLDGRDKDIIDNYKYDVKA